MIRTVCCCFLLLSTCLPNYLRPALLTLVEVDVATGYFGLTVLQLLTRKEKKKKKAVSFSQSLKTLGWEGLRLAWLWSHVQPLDQSLCPDGHILKLENGNGEKILTRVKEGKRCWKKKYLLQPPTWCYFSNPTLYILIYIAVTYTTSIFFMTLIIYFSGSLQQHTESLEEVHMSFLLSPHPSHLAPSTVQY